MSAGATTPSGPPWDEQHDEHRQRRPGRRLLWILIVAAVLAVALLVGWLPHQKRNKEVNAKAKQQQNSVPVVEVQTVHGASAEQELTLPGTVTPLKSAHIYAQASGFLKARYVDLGDTVRKGQLLGLISAPDLDTMVSQQTAMLQQSKDGVVTAQAALRLQQVTYDRVHTLVLHGILSQAGGRHSTGGGGVGTVELAGRGECGEGGAGGAGPCANPWRILSRYARPSTAR